MSGRLADSATYDVAIVGAGSAGCVVANRLSEESDTRVLLLEAGPGDRNPWLKIPAGFTRVFFHESLNWGYLTDPEPQLDHRAIYWPRGKTLGGCSSINAMVYIRGHARDYDDWARQGNPGWSWADVLPHFRRSERYELGVSGPDFRHAASEAFVAAAAAAGVPRTEDLNDGDLGGVGFLQFTIRRGVRHSAATAFLKPIRARANLQILTNAHVERLRFEGRRVTGLTYRRGGQTHSIDAKQVILCAGALNSPQLLMLSGIGPGEHLRSVGIDVRHELAGVGENLQDHFYVGCSARTRPEASMNAQLSGWRLAKQVATYLMRRRGVLALGASQASAFVRSSAHADRPDLQINFMPLSFGFTTDGRVVADSFPGLTISVAHLQPESRGRLRLTSADAFAPPSIQANYLQVASDRQAILTGLRWIRRILAQPALSCMIERETIPGTQCRTDEDLLAYVRANGGSLFHPVGTCRMGSDRFAVVDERLRVHGIEGLRVADAAIMPTIVSGNTNAPAMMIGAKAAEFVKADLRRASRSSP